MLRDNVGSKNAARKIPSSARVFDELRILIAVGAPQTVVHMSDANGNGVLSDQLPRSVQQGHAVGSSRNGQHQ
jgi:hypothetical protein